MIDRNGTGKTLACEDGAFSMIGKEIDESARMLGAYALLLDNAIYFFCTGV